MTSWSTLLADAPDLAPLVQSRFAAHRHSTLATVRRSGAPRTSGIETQFTLGELWMGMMGGSRKAADLQRDPRFELHSTSADAEMADGDARIAGRAVEVTDAATIAAWRGDVEEIPDGPFHLFRAEVTELVLVTVAVDHLVIASWHEGRGVTRVDRY